jgi:VWFA-related protein
VAIALSDGEDNDSGAHDLVTAGQELQQADCIFYAVNPSGPSIRLNVVSQRGQRQLVRLAAETGGAVFLPDSPAELDAIFARIAAELEAQYLLGYYSPEQGIERRFRRIRVRVPGRPHLSVRARQGYYSSPHATARAHPLPDGETPADRPARP